MRVANAWVLQLHQKRIRSKEDLQRKQEKISRKYNPTRERVEQQLSPGFLEGALEEVNSQFLGCFVIINCLISDA